MRFEIHHHIHTDPETTGLLRELDRKLSYIIGRLSRMATDAQIATLKSDIADLIAEAVKDIEAAVAAAQNQSSDPSIDALDAQIKATTQTLKDDAAKLVGPIPPTP